ncbi:kinase-like domain-containing protein [Rhizoctonia solani]|nr:kinase-like domain-containing protein [Rhizoctonia solani]
MTVLYDFTPEWGDEGTGLAVREGQSLLLLDASVDEVDGDLTVTEHEALLVYCVEGDWVLVKSPHQRAAGYVPRARIQLEQELNRVIALYDNDAESLEELSFKQGEILTVLNRDNEEWWYCANANYEIGMVPYNFVEIMSTIWSWSKTQVCSGSGISTTEDLTFTTTEDHTADDIGTASCQTIISRHTDAREVMSRLITHGCNDLTSAINLSTFDEHPVSYGEFGDVYRGRLTDEAETLIAVKILRIPMNDRSWISKNVKDAARELHTWSKCSHPNVLPLLGLGLFRGRIGMISPWQREGRLPLYLERTQGVNQYNLSVQICEGLSYLHQIGIIHGDLKAETNSHSEKSDVYALGMEVMTSQLPYYGKSDVLVILLVVQKREPPERPETIPDGHETMDNTWELLLRCWSFESTARPSATDVAEAVKILRAAAVLSRKMEPKHLKHAARELHTWSRCKHPNIMPLLGLAVFRDRIGMVATWMKHGNLTEYLKVVSGVSRYNMCVQICEGLSYLHHIRIIHCDLKGANVLVSDEGIPLLTDFGTSLVSDRTLRFTATTSGPSCTLRWSAAEILQEINPHTESSDVYALGMTIYETISGEIPYHGKNEYNVICLVTLERELPARPTCMPIGDGETDKLWKLLVRCWSYAPESRPSATEVTSAMKEIA